MGLESGASSAEGYNVADNADLLQLSRELPDNCWRLLEWIKTGGELPKGLIGSEEVITLCHLTYRLIQSKSTYPHPAPHAVTADSPEAWVLTLDRGEGLWALRKQRGKATGPATTAGSSAQPCQPGQTAKTPLTDSERRVLELIKGAPDGIMGPQIVAALSKEGIRLAQSTLTRHIIPKLKARGVKNRRGAGYYLPT